LLQIGEMWLAYKVVEKRIKFTCTLCSKWHKMTTNIGKGKQISVVTEEHLTTICRNLTKKAWAQHVQMVHCVLLPSLRLTDVFSSCLWTLQFLFVLFFKPIKSQISPSNSSVRELMNFGGPSNKPI
jgi:hypothetical protein